MRSITLGFSPCPNDTFIFHALVTGRVTVPGIEFIAHLADVETLNRMALAAALDVTKVSYGALPELLGRYVPLRSGGALGRGCGPLLVAKTAAVGGSLAQLRIAIPGRLTTAHLLLRLFSPESKPGIEMEYSRILAAVASGEVDAGLIIHESRFTYPDYGLTALVDLGEWWERTTSSPIPLGAIVARRDLRDTIAAIDVGVRGSVEYALRHPSESASYVESYAQEMAPDVIRRHISLYVNKFSVDVGDDGETAIRGLLTRAADAGLLPAGYRDPFDVAALLQV